VEANVVVLEVQSIELTLLCFHRRYAAVEWWESRGEERRGEGRAYRKCRMIYYPSSADGILS
jgi:hypothetical protein